MNQSGYQTRRATLDDLVHLRASWQAAKLPALELEKRFTEFQVVFNSGGELIGSAGLRIDKHHAVIHSATYKSVELEEGIRAAIWERIQAVARNHGLARLWQLESVSFWRENGFREPTAQELQRLPSAFGPASEPWLTLPLREESLNAISLEQEFELFSQAQKNSTDRMMRQAQGLKTFAYLLMTAVIIVAVIGVIFLFRHQSDLRR